MREQRQSLRKLAAGSFAIAGAARQQAEMQPRHRERGIEIGRDPIMLDGALRVPCVLAAQGANVVRPGVELIEPKQAATTSSAASIWPLCISNRPRAAVHRDPGAAVLRPTRT